MFIFFQSTIGRSDLFCNLIENGRCFIQRIRPFRFGVFCFLGVILFGFQVAAAEKLDGRPPMGAGKGWFSRYEGGMVHQLKTELDGGGDFEVNRFVSRVSVGYRSDYLNSTALSIGYSRDAYDFSGSTGFATSDPWGEINTMSVGLPIRRSIGDKWMLFAVPSARLLAEDHADLNDSLVGGGIAGVSYEVNPRLKLGPGLGALTQLEDGASYFPIVIVDWKISEKLKLETGRGLGASQGPGLLLTYSWSDSWSFLAGGRYERLRFRLNRNGATPNGVGEDSGVSAYLGARYTLGERGVLTLFGGADVLGEFQIYDSSGNEIGSRDYKAAPFLGVSTSLRF
ncbi:TonB-dependent receptor [Verrucomicrobia bacterium]|nr:TonB-dependent receptor [Verrucomicrobiota bacterium]MDA7866899.1 TonB-dependent receptor [Verrucomicrobiota bacterium]